MVVDVERTEKRYWQLKEGMCRNKELVEGRSRWGGGCYRSPKCLPQGTVI